MTASAGRGHRHCAFANDIDAIVDNVVRISIETISQGEKPKRGERSLIVAERQLVSRNLLQDKSIVRKIFIERANDVIAIGVRVEITRVAIIAYLAARVAVMA